MESDNKRALDARITPAVSVVVDPSLDKMGHPTQIHFYGHRRLYNVNNQLEYKQIQEQMCIIDR